MQTDFTEAKAQIDSVEQTLRKLKYENEKLYKEYQALKQDKSQAQTLSDESYRKKIKSLTGELEMFDAFADSFHKLCQTIPGVANAAKSELTKIHTNLKGSIGYMREICSDQTLGVPKGKRVQRQVRYERLKEEFGNLISKLGS